MEHHSDELTSSDVEKTTPSIDNKSPEAEALHANPPPRTINGWKWVVVVLSILSSTFLFALDNTITANIQAEIVRDFEAVNKLSWISVGLVMSASATVLLWGKIFFQFNTKWTYIVSVLIFEIGSAVCGSAPNMNALIVGRVLCGIGGSGLYTGVITLLAATTTLQERPMYVASTGMTWGLGMVLGPIVGGGFSQSSVGWRWAFYINLVIGGACAPVYLLLIPNIDPRKGAGFVERVREIDWLGSILNLGAFLTGVMAISFGGLTWAWGSGNIIGLFVCSGVLFILLGIQQSFTIFTTTTRRILPLEFSKSRTMLILFAVTSAAGTACFVPVYMVPLLFQFTRGDGALDAGVRLLPFIIPCIFMIIVNGGVMSAYGYYMPWYVLGGALVLVGGALFHTVGVDTSTAHIYGYSVIAGLGTGMYLQASFSVAQATVSLDMVASASAFITCAQVVGTTIALAIANSVFLNESQKGIVALLPNITVQEVESIISGTSGILPTLSEGKRIAVESAIVHAMGQTYILVIVAGALTLVLGVLMKRERLFLQPAAAA